MNTTVTATPPVGNCALQFTVQLPGSGNMNNYFYGYTPTSSPILALPTPEFRYQDTTGTNPPYASNWAELTFFLQAINDPNSGNQLTTTNGTPLWGLYMRQRLLDNYSTGTGQFQITGANTYDYVEVSGTFSGTTLTCNRPIDIVSPPRRFGMNSTVTGTPPGDQINSSGQFASTFYTTLATDTSSNTAASTRFKGSDLLLTNVVSFEVRLLVKNWSDFADVFQLAGTYFQGNKAFNATSGPMVFDTWSQLNDTTSTPPRLRLFGLARRHGNQPL
jgi:hypothetical protein